jgi:hypothetical protein
VDIPYSISTHTKSNYEAAREAIIAALKQKGFRGLAIVSISIITTEPPGIRLCQRPRISSIEGQHSPPSISMSAFPV